MSDAAAKKLITVAKKGDNVNKRALRALVFPVKKSHTNSSAAHTKQLPEDPFENLTAGGNILEPPFNLLSLSMLPEQNTELNQVIEAMETNIEGFGHRVIPRLNVDSESATPELKANVNREKVFLENFFNYIGLDDSFTALRRKIRRDLEITGNAYMEIIRNAAGKIQGATVIPSYQIRLGVQEEEFTDIDFPILELQEDGSVIASSIPTAKRFRAFVQSRITASGNSITSTTPKVRWFKEFGDPRVRDNRSGEVVPPNKVANWDGKGNPMPEHRMSNELVHFKIYSARSSYGIPRYIGNLLSIYGDRASEEINFTTFQNNNIPSMMIMVSNGQVTQGTLDRINSFAEEQIAGSDNYSKFLILEAEGEFEGEDGGNVKLDVKQLTESQHKDALFQDYSKNNQEKIRRAWRLPQIFTGNSNNINRATVEASRKLADEQVFAPERVEFDSFMNRRLFPAMGIVYHKFQSNSPNTTDNTELVKILATAEKTGGISPKIARMIIADILGDKELPPIPEKQEAGGVFFDPNLPMSLSMAVAVKNMADPVEPGQQVTALKIDELNALLDSEDGEE